MSENMPTPFAAARTLGTPVEEVLVAVDVDALGHVVRAGGAATASGPGFRGWVTWASIARKAACTGVDRPESRAYSLVSSLSTSSGVIPVWSMIFLAISCAE